MTQWVYLEWIIASPTGYMNTNLFDVRRGTAASRRAPMLSDDHTGNAATPVENHYSRSEIHHSSFDIHHSFPLSPHQHHRARHRMAARLKTVHIQPAREGPG